MPEKDMSTYNNFYELALGKGDPVKEFEHLLGLWALRFLVATLAITPLRDLFGINFTRSTPHTDNGFLSFVCRAILMGCAQH